MIRFATREKHPLSGRRTGLFTAAYLALRSPDLDSHEADSLREVLSWFEENLTGPELDEDRAVFLFKSDASDCVRRIWALVHALRDAGVWCEMQTVTNPGRIVYEDAHQVAVVPWADSTSI